jgi:hypothetical protein
MCKEYKSGSGMGISKRLRKDNQHRVSYNHTITQYDILLFVVVAIENVDFKCIYGAATCLMCMLPCLPPSCNTSSSTWGQLSDDEIVVQCR